MVKVQFVQGDGKAALTYHTVPEWLALHPEPCRSTLYELLRQNLVPHVRVGRRILIPDDALEVMMEQRKEGLR